MTRRQSYEVVVVGGGPRCHEHWQASLDTFEEVGAPQDALTTLRHLTVLRAGR